MTRVVFVAEWDAEARVWTGISEEIAGLILEADTLVELFRDAAEEIPEMVALNRVDMPDGSIGGEGEP